MEKENLKENFPQFDKINPDCYQRDYYLTQDKQEIFGKTCNEQKSFEAGIIFVDDQFGS